MQAAVDYATKKIVSGELKEVYKAKAEKVKVAKERIEAEMDDAVQQYEENPDAFVEYDVVELREKLLQDAKENGYRGSIDIREPLDDRSRFAGKNFILYEPVTTGLQDTGSASAGGYQKMMPK